VGLRDLAFFVNDIRDAAGVFVFFGVAGAVGEADLLIGIA
jgi:hypothetical protein